MALNVNLYKSNTLPNRNLIVLIHGLGATKTTWSKGNSSWTDLLLSDSNLKDIDVAEVLYDTAHLINGVLSKMGIKKIKTGFWGSYSIGSNDITSLEVLSRELKRELDSEKFSSYENIILVCHSMGGLLAARYILEEYENENIPKINGFISLATPYSGSLQAVYNELFASKLNRNKHVSILKPNSDFLDTTNRLWQKHINYINIPMKFYFGTQDNTVSENSALPIVVSKKWGESIPLPGDHSSILEVSSHEDTNYRHISEAIRKILKKKYEVTLSEIDQINARMKARLISNGVPIGIIPNLMSNISFESDYLLPDSEQQLKFIIGEFGSGKSMLLDFIYLEKLTDFFEAKRRQKPLFRTALECLKEDIINLIEKNNNNLKEEFWIFIDGLDEIALLEASSIYENLRVASLRWKNVRILASSRPNNYVSEQVEKVWIKPLNEEAIIKIIGVLTESDNGFAGYYNLERDLKHVVSKPLFTIIYGLYLSDNKGYGISNVADLISYFLDRTLKELSGVEGKIENKLIELAIKSTLNGNIPIYKFDVATLDEYKEMFETGLIKEEQGYISFNLPIFAQWYAAKGLANGKISINQIIEKHDLYNWKYPLIIMKVAFGNVDVNKILTNISEFDPGLAAIVIKNSLSRRKELEATSELEAGNQIRIAIKSLISSLGIIKSHIAPINEDGKLSPIGITLDEYGLSVSWYKGREPINSVVEIDRNERFNHKDWPRWQSYSTSLDNWHWEWALKFLKDNLKKMLDSKNLPIVNEVIYKELVWKVLLVINKKGSLYTKDFDETEVKEKISKLSKVGFTEISISSINFKKVAVPNDWIANLPNNLDFQEYNRYPYIRPDLNLKKNRGYIWDNYSKQQLYKKTIQIYELAIEAYMETVDILFGSLKHRMYHFVMYPFILKGSFSMPSNDRGPGLDWYIEPLPQNYQKCKVEIAFESREEHIRVKEEKYFKEGMQKIKRYRSKDYNWLKLVSHGESLSNILFEADPVTTIVINWIKNDLQDIDWYK